MLRRCCGLLGRPAPVIGLVKKARYAGIDDNPTVTYKPWDVSEPLMADYGWQRGKLPKFRARSPFHRQQIARRMVTELIRKDHVIVGGARAPALRILADHVVELAKAGDTDSRQQLAYFLQDPLMVDKAFDEYPRRFKDMTGKYAMMTRLKGRRRADNVAMYFVEYKNRDLSDNHKGEDYTTGPERFFLPPRIIETEKGIQRPPHMQMAFDRVARQVQERRSSTTGGACGMPSCATGACATCHTRATWTRCGRKRRRRSGIMKCSPTRVSSRTLIWRTTSSAPPAKAASTRKSNALPSLVGS
ncbi:large subunit ribosomal protein L17 [Strigomonas culicis]|uniref:Large subunit ribosomal protein L17 n=1 Tax=Strigomonas culicis TaxID=28005 RepID=S9TZV7_9TRYP|nr:large subunit ribosomal protein L17 [Strigomonas culicis]|eukprot:EPY22183.1 large subunit ribosomal protein L17 [Strigomonas culicis]